MINIVLHEPEIPANTGNIGRTCCAAGVKLHLIKPLGFRLDEKSVKRAGLDYWEHLEYEVYEDYEDFLLKNPEAKIYYATTKAPYIYSEVQYESDCFIMFGKENQETCVRIPMNPKIRSLNLSNSVAIVLYEALRQNRFEGMQTEGKLRTHKWREI